MYLAYVDESGSSGSIASGGSRTFTLGCVLVESAHWPDVFENVIDFRRFLRDRFGVPVRAEIKANHLLRNGGAFRDLKLSERARFAIYRGAMRLAGKLDVKVFAIVIRKEEMLRRGRTEDPHDVAWEYLLQRLERLTTKGKTEALLVHDEGETQQVRGLARRARRAGTAGAMFGTGTLRRPARLILDDPVPRQSHQSYFLQLADLAAYAAFRRVYPAKERPVQIVPVGMWDELGDARFGPANALAGGPVGIVVWP